MARSGSRDVLLTSEQEQSGGVLALSVLSAFFVSFAEVVVRMFTGPETYHGRQIGLAVSSNFAMVGLVVVTMRLALFPLTGVVGRLGNSGATRALSVVATLGIVGGVLALTDLVGVGPEFSIATKWAFIAVGSIGTVIVAGRLGRWKLIRHAAVAGWIISAAGTAYAGWITVDHLRPWLSRAGGMPVATAKRPNVLLIVLDTLRFDRVGVYGDSKLTPNLDRFAADALVYTKAISTAPWTLPMHASLFTGLYPREHRVSWGNYALDESVPVLAELLKEAGYSTFAVSNNWLLNRENGFARGFDDFLEAPNDAHVNAWRLTLQMRLAQQAARWLNAGLVGRDAGSALTNLLLEKRFQGEAVKSNPFFAFINYFEPHDPYHPPAEYLKRFLTPSQREQYSGFQQRQDDLCAQACGRRDTFGMEQIDLMAALYDAEVAYQDAMFGELMATLDRLDLLKETWIFVTSDHGELFGERNLVFHTAGAHYQLLHVPLLVRPPGGTTHTRIDSPVQPVDVFHKIVEIGGATLPTRVTRSFSLPLNRAAPVREMCVSETFGASITGLYVTQYRDMQTDVTQWMHWITSVYHDGHLLEFDGSSPSGLFDVEQDPAMNRNLLGDKKEKASEIRELFRQWSGEELDGGAI